MWQNSTDANVDQLQHLHRQIQHVWKHRVACDRAAWVCGVGTADCKASQLYTTTWQAATGSAATRWRLQCRASYFAAAPID